MWLPLCSMLSLPSTRARARIIPYTIMSNKIIAVIETIIIVVLAVVVVIYAQVLVARYQTARPPSSLEESGETIVTPTSTTTELSAEERLRILNDLQAAASSTELSNDERQGILDQLSSNASGTDLSTEERQQVLDSLKTSD